MTISFYCAILCCYDEIGSSITNQKSSLKIEYIKENKMKYIKEAAMLRKDGERKFSDVLMDMVETPVSAFEQIAKLDEKGLLNKWSQENTGNVYLIDLLSSLMFNKSETSVVSAGALGEENKIIKIGDYKISVIFPSKQCGCMAIEIDGHIIALQYNPRKEAWDAGWIYIIDSLKKDLYFKELIENLAKSSRE